MDAARLRPLGIGEVLDAGSKIYRARFRAQVIATTILIGTMYVLFGLAQLSVAPDDSEFGTGFGAEFGTAEVEPTTEEGLVSVVAVLLGGAMLFVITQFATAVAVKIVASAYLGEESTWREALRAVWSRKRSIVWLSVLYGLFAAAAVAIVIVLALLAALLSIGGAFAVFLAVIAGIALFVAGIYFYVSWMAAVPVLMTENLTAGQSLRRSRQLVRKRWWPVLFAFMLAGILASVVTWVFSAALIGIVAVSGNTLVENVANVTVNTVVAALTSPFIAAVVVVVYFDLRVRKEGFDLELLARSVGVAPEGQSAFASPPLPSPPPPPLPSTGADDPSRPPFWPPPPGWRPPDA
jgi:hypothetical protein